MSYGYYGDCTSPCQQYYQQPSPCYTTPCYPSPCAPPCAPLCCATGPTGPIGATGPSRLNVSQAFYQQSGTPQVFPGASGVQINALNWTGLDTNIAPIPVSTSGFYFPQTVGSRGRWRVDGVFNFNVVSASAVQFFISTASTGTTQFDSNSIASTAITPVSQTTATLNSSFSCIINYTAAPSAGAALYLLILGTASASVNHATLEFTYLGQ